MSVGSISRAAVTNTPPPATSKPTSEAAGAELSPDVMEGINAAMAVVMSGHLDPNAGKTEKAGGKTAMDGNLGGAMMPGLQSKSHTGPSKNSPLSEIMTPGAVAPGAHAGNHLSPGFKIGSEQSGPSGSFLKGDDGHKIFAGHGPNKGPDGPFLKDGDHKIFAGKGPGAGPSGPHLNGGDGRQIFPGTPDNSGASAAKEAADLIKKSV